MYGLAHVTFGLRSIVLSPALMRRNSRKQGPTSMGPCRDTGGFFVLYDEEAERERERGKSDSAAGQSSTAGSGFGSTPGAGNGSAGGAYGGASSGRRGLSTSVRQGVGRSWR